MKKEGWVDLHLHLDGSLSLASIKKLAEIQGVVLPEDEDKIVEKLTVSGDCRDLNEYLEKFEFPCSLLQTKDAIELAVFQLQEELKSQGLRYAEIRFAPQKHCEKGLSQDEVVQAALAGLERSDFPANLILCCMRGRDNEKENRETIDVAARYRERGVCAVDLAGAEALFPTAQFEELFCYAREKGLRFTIHAGEADGPESVRKALDFGASRIGHGVRSLEDSELVKRLAEEKIPLELCPTSNLNTALFESYEQYPLRELMEAGVIVTINTDNMSVSGTTMEREMEKMREACSLTDEMVETLRNNAIRASFASEGQKRSMETWQRGEFT